MALTKLTVREMVKLGGDLVREGGPERSAIERVGAARGLLPALEKAVEALIEAQAPKSTDVAELTAQLGALDLRHDDLVRALDGRLEAEQYATTDPVVREAFARVRTALFPSGRTIVQRSYVEQAGEAPLRAKRVEDADRMLLHGLETYGDRTLHDLYDELQQVAADIGAAERKRTRLGAEGERMLKAQAARLQWIRAVNALAAVLECESIDPKPILGSIRAAEANAERGGARTAPPGSSDPQAPEEPTGDGPVEPLVD